MTPSSVTRNTLFYGDNLYILREYIPDESVDLIYLDPPFNSNRSYNVLFKEQSGASSDAQITAFDDSWTWGAAAEDTYHELMRNNPGKVDDAIAAILQIIGKNPMMAYLVMMAARLVELHRVLKPTGSLYLHCDPTASHYLKVILDTVFGVENLVNEIAWVRTAAKALSTRRFPNNHDVILGYSKSKDYTWNSDVIFRPYDLGNLDEKTAQKYTQRDVDGRLYQLSDLTNPNPDRPNLTYEFLGITKVWRWTKERMQAAYAAGLVIQPRPGAVPRLKRYLDEQRGKPLGDVWDDIPPINSQAAERLGYPTQKPVALLERIIQASSNPGDLILDPFCGCGTAIAAAEKLGRRWVGIDITHLAIALQKYRLKDNFKLEPVKDYAIVGEPRDLAAAGQLAQDDRFQFQWWALSLVRARPAGGDATGKKGKKGADQGIDGIINFIDDDKSTLKRVIVQVKSGHVKSGDVRDLRGVIEREGAAMAVFVTLEAPTPPMIKEALEAGKYTSPIWQKEYPRIQILTIEELLNGKEVNMPPDFGTFKKAEKVKKAEGKQGELF